MGAQEEENAAPEEVPKSEKKVTSVEVEQHVPLGNRLFGVLILIIFVGLCFIYGFEGKIRYIDNSSIIATPNSQFFYGILFVMCCLFVVVGWGLLLSFFKKSTASGLLISLFTVCFTMVIAPPIQKWWFNVLVGGFGTYIFDDTQSPRRMLYRSLEGSNVQLDFYNLKLVLASSISQLVVAMAIFGKMNAVQVILHSMLYNFMWTFNFFLCVVLQENGPDDRLFDDYQISMVYLFGACYGLMASLVNSKPPLVEQFSSTRQSALLSALGAFFMFLSFATTSVFFSLKFSATVTTESALTYVWQEAFISVFFAMSSSVVFTYAFSCLLGERIGIREALFSSIAGGVVFGPVAATVTNIAAPIALGLAAGIISTVFYRKVYVSVNSEEIKDTFGMLNFLILSLLGTFFFAPIIIRAQYNHDIIISPLNRQQCLLGSLNACASLPTGKWQPPFIPDRNGRPAPRLLSCDIAWEG